jgi:hypothetical protein
MARVTPRRHPVRRALGVTRLVDAAGRIPAVVLCALAGHAAVYGSFAPEGSGHSYFAWYTPAVTILSTASLALLPLALAASLTARPSRFGRVVRVLLSTRSADHDVRRRSVELAAGSLCFLVAQETLERSLATHGLSLPHFGPSTWLVLLAAVATAAGLVAFVGRAFGSLVDDLLGRAVPAGSRRATTLRPVLVAVSSRPRPLAVHGALRAPPTLL